MRSFIALIRREALEHRLAYVLAPAGLLALIAAACLYVWLAAPDALGIELPIPSGLKLYEVGYALALQGWWYYALVSLFFYYADAFHGDTRNNAMLFWKSMPQSDFTISASKLLAGFTVFPGTLFVAALATGLLLILPAGAAAVSLETLLPLDYGDALRSYLALSAIGAVYFVLGLLWYAPFFAWVALLSTMLGRWSIPLAFLIPAIAVVFEFLVLRLEGAPGGSYVLSFLTYRTSLGFGAYNLELTLLLSNPIEAFWVIGDMAANYDWVSMIGGLVIAVILLMASADYRRRFLLT